MTARDRAGRDVTATLARADGDVYASPAARIASANAADPDDFLELRFPRPAGSEAVLTLRLRNSLLNTVLFYDMMLGQAGAGAVDWIGQDMDRIGTLVEMGRWFQDAMGLRVDVFDGREWVQVSRLTDTGPIAWEEVGVRIRSPDTDLTRMTTTSGSGFASSPMPGASIVRLLERAPISSSTRRWPSRAWSDRNRSDRTSPHVWRVPTMSTSRPIRAHRSSSSSIHRRRHRGRADRTSWSPRATTRSGCGPNGSGAPIDPVHSSPTTPRSRG